MPDAFPFDPAKLAALGRLSAKINGTHAPPPIPGPIVIDEDGRVRLPVPDHDAPRVIDNRSFAELVERKYVSAELHAGLTLQWAPMAEAGGLVIEFRGGEPDGDENRDAVAVFLTRKGLAGLARDLQAIVASLDAAA